MFYHSLPKAGAVRRAGRWVLRQIRPNDDSRVASGIERLNPWQEGFCAWNAARLGISPDDSLRRYRESWLAMPGGHGGAAFRRFCEMQMKVFSVIADDSPAECHDAYQFHSWLFLLRQVSLPVPTWKSDHPIVRALSDRKAPVILDYGCGLAQTSISLALALQSTGARPQLLLADIPSVRLEFTTWLCGRLGLACRTLACTPERPFPPFAPADVVVATEIFEHLHDPLPATDALDAALQHGGFIITNVDDHETEFMHVCPDLGEVRDRLAVLGYVELHQHVLYRKAQAESLPDYQAAVA